jgi:glutathione S-transferase
MSTPDLYGIHYSPWSLRARWALDHHQIDYRYREHTPLLGEWALRFRGRNRVGGGPVTVPLLVLQNRAIGDSFEIICFADEVGGAEPLRASHPDVALFINGLESAYDAARRRVTRRILGDQDALKEAAAAAVPAWLAGPSRPVAAMGTRFIARKYGFDPDASESLHVLREALDQVRSALGDGPYIDDTFSAKDIAAACLVGAIRPHDSLCLGPAMRAAWTHEEVAERYRDLLDWRDGLLG